jgi:cytidylate kinase
MRGENSFYSSYISSQIKSLQKDAPHDHRLNNPFVTISRQTGTQGIAIAQGLCEYLQTKERRAKCIWTVFDKELLAKVAQEHDLPETLLPYLSEGTVSEIRDMIEESLGLHPSHDLLVMKTNSTILHLAQLGYAIFVGRGANIVTAKMRNGVNIRLVCPIEKRIAHVQKHHGLNQKEAGKFVLQEDAKRRAYVKRYFAEDVENPLLYDMVINVEDLSRPEIIQAIGDLVFRRHPQRR